MTSQTLFLNSQTKREVLTQIAPWSHNPHPVYASSGLVLSGAVWREVSERSLKNAEEEIMGSIDATHLSLNSVLRRRESQMARETAPTLPISTKEPSEDESSNPAPGPPGSFRTRFVPKGCWRETAFQRACS